MRSMIFIEKQNPYPYLNHQMNIIENTCYYISYNNSSDLAYQTNVEKYNYLLVYYSLIWTYCDICKIKL